MSAASPSSSSKSPSNSTTKTPSTPSEVFNDILSSAQPAPTYSQQTWNPSNPYFPHYHNQNMTTTASPPEPIMPPTPALFTTPPILQDTLQTLSSKEQLSTAEICMKHLSNPSDPFPILSRRQHIAFLESGILGGRNGKLPHGMVLLDASRPWIIYWCLQGLDSLGVDVGKYRERVISSLRPLQNESGGFGGGNGQVSHVTASYAAVLALATVSRGEGEDGEEGEEALGIVDRRAMFHWLHEIKDWESGGFRVCVGGEEDVRGVYCALVILALLGLPTSGNLVKGAKEYLGRCQTYEGGFGATPNGNEAHGGYAFCTLAGLCILGEPAEVLRKHLDMDRLVSWLSARQYAPEGGLSGRTNKLVDGCYSTWVGGCWALIEAGIDGPQDEKEVALGQNKAVGSLWSREGLARYIMSCCQSPKGGLRDKPGKNSDYYHANYILLGLASTQNYFYYTPSPMPLPSSSPQDNESEDLPLPLTAPFLWRYSPRIPSNTPNVAEAIIEDMPEWPDDVEEEDMLPGQQIESDRLKVHHPIFNIPFERVGEIERWWKEKVGF
ncbi:terpenoid cyclases/Protein prenyltransferase [Choiromyces venosus 120613-1]|uniref:Protein farnesyltransferase subunit beta n=1 Tax=Choiromyces venosus 120613-1 TaxID=1336337 RepID=A0A3N4K2D1_9PEZI|nr:terpenoid cyclases/Protein prenyltransferase [Choiromyces venosus 120613-1]